jgi:hypothetical protein
VNIAPTSAAGSVRLRTLMLDGMAPLPNSAHEGNGDLAGSFIIQRRFKNRCNLALFLKTALVILESDLRAAP